MSFLRTVLGDISADAADVCYAHEHLIIDHSFTTFTNPEFLLDSVDAACIDIAEFARAGGKTLIDSMPCGGGRNVRKLAEIAQNTGTNIVCPTGVHLALYYAPGHCSSRLDAQQLARLFIDEIEQGIDYARVADIRHVAVVADVEREVHGRQQHQSGQRQGGP